MTNDVRRHHFNNQKIYLLRIFPLIQPLFPLGNDYFHQNNIDLHVEIIHCIQAIWRHWSREPITTLSRPSVFILEFSEQLTTPDRFSYHTGRAAPPLPTICGRRRRRLLLVGAPLMPSLLRSYFVEIFDYPKYLSCLSASGLITWPSAR